VQPIKELPSAAWRCAGRGCALIRQLANYRSVLPYIIVLHREMMLYSKLDLRRRGPGAVRAVRRVRSMHRQRSSLSKIMWRLWSVSYSIS